MSYLDQFLKETNSSQQQVQQTHSTRLLYLEGGSIESEEGDIEDNRTSIASSKSNLSELSIVCVVIFLNEEVIIAMNFPAWSTFAET